MFRSNLLTKAACGKSCTLPSGHSSGLPQRFLPVVVEKYMHLGQPSALRLLIALLLVVSLRGEPISAELKEVLKDFRSEGSPGWAFTQKTEGAGKKMLERYDPRLTEYHRWVLIEKDGRAPTAEETQRYNQLQTRRSTGQSAPNVKDQIDESTGEILSDDGTRVRWRFKLHATDKDDSSAPHMAATFTLHRPTRTIERVELASFEPFRPVLGISISQARTVIDYSLPENDRPTLLKQVAMTVRGKAWFFKSMDEDLVVTYTDYESARQKK